jgi:hypothetical protein
VGAQLFGNLPVQALRLDGLQVHARKGPFRVRHDWPSGQAN